MFTQSFAAFFVLPSVVSLLTLSCLGRDCLCLKQLSDAASLLTFLSEAPWEIVGRLRFLWHFNQLCAGFHSALLDMLCIVCCGILITRYAFSNQRTILISCASAPMYCVFIASSIGSTSILFVNSLRSTWQLHRKVTSAASFNRIFDLHF